MTYKQINRFRKAHRFLGIFIGIQFLFWTISGLYFSWTDIDEIHGDQFLNEIPQEAFSKTLLTDSLFQKLAFPLHKLELKTVGKEPFFWVNDSILLHPKTGVLIEEISEKQALEVVQIHVRSDFSPQNTERITSVGKHDEYRGSPLPAYRISLSGEGNPVAYVDARSGNFERIRHQQWRWFDFLWMTHTMDYKGRDDFNTFILRAFSLLGLITVFSGFALAFVTSKRRKKKA